MLIGFFIKHRLNVLGVGKLLILIKIMIKYEFTPDLQNLPKKRLRFLNLTFFSE